MMSVNVRRSVDMAAEYFGFEKPEGRLPDSPHIYVSGQVIARRGMPEVDYASLSDLFGSLGHKNPQKITIFMVGSTALNTVDSLGLPYFLPSGMVFPVLPSLRNVMLLNAIAPLNHEDPHRYFMDRVVYQAARMGQSHKNAPIIGRTAMESLAGRSYVSWLGDVIGDKTPFLPSLLSILAFRAVYAHSEYGHVDARRVTEGATIERHLRAVRFPVYAEPVI